MPMDLSDMNLEERTKYLELKEKYKKKLRPWYKKWWGILILSITALLIIVGTILGFYIYSKIPQIRAEKYYNQQLVVNEAMQLAISGVGTNYFLGTEGARITIIEFADFACPFSQKASKIIRETVTRYPGKVKAVYRDMPLFGHSIDLSLAARCAGEQGKFWEMHDLLFENQAELSAAGEGLSSMLSSLVGTLGINKETYDSCYSSKKYLSDIGTDFGDSAALQLPGTPIWFINGKRLSGYIPEEDFFKIIDSLLTINVNE